MGINQYPTRYVSDVDVVLSSAAPTTPDVGDIWVDTSAEVPSYDLLSSKIAGPNYVHNGAFNVWQRGTGTFTGVGYTYSADRWSVLRNWSEAGLSATRVAGTGEFRYALRVQRDSANASAAQLFLQHIIETANSIPLAGQTVTLSFYAKAGANFSAASSQLQVAFYTGTGTDQSLATMGAWTGNIRTATYKAITTSWVRYSVTLAVPSTATQIGVEFNYLPTGTAGAADYVDITGVQLERGSTPTQYQHKDYGQELRECQRYYCHSGGYNLSPPDVNTAAYSIGGNAVDIEDACLASVYFPVPMRISPNITVGRCYSYDGSKYKTITAVYGTVNGIGYFTHDSGNSGAGYVLGRPYKFPWIASADF